MVTLLPLPSQDTEHINNKFRSLAGSCLFQLYALRNEARFPICAEGPDLLPLLWALLPSPQCGSARSEHLR